ncbi:MAG: reprolysin-like metallopeptidase [Vicinamibacterales bacterium]
MISTRLRRQIFAAVALLLASSPALAQPAPKRLLERAPGQSAQARGRSVAATRHVLARVDSQALDSDRIELPLFDDVQVTARRSSRSHARAGSTVWIGKLELPDRGQVTLASVDGVISGSVTANGRSFEIAMSEDGLHEVREVNHALFPSEDPPLPALELVSSAGSSTSSTTTTSATSSSNGQIDVMVVWTPAARSALGGSTAAIQSVVDLAVANANASYANSQINTSLRLVYSGEVSFTESPSNLSSDLSRLAGTNDEAIDEVHSLRDQYGADIVTLLGSGYASAGYCGIGYLMSSVSTSFASSAFNVVDQSCAGGYLSYAHEVGHNQGLHHDPANASGEPAYSYAYGFQEPSGAFRTVMSYGGATRVQQFSNPNVFYSGLPTGTATQNNAAALNQTAATVASFRSAVGGTTTTCDYALTPTSMTFDASGGTATVDVTTQSGCPWSTGSGASWVNVGSGGSGPGSVVLSVTPNVSGQRSATATVSGMAVSITEAGATVATPCTYTVTPTSLGFSALGESYTVNVTTQAVCSWGATTGTSWVSVGSGTTGSATVVVTASSNSGGSRTGTASVAGQTLTLAQSGAVAPTTTPCRYTLSSTSVTLPARGGTAQVLVTTTSGCAWTARSNTRWLKVAGGASSSGSVTLQVDKASRGGRTGTAVIAGQTVTVIQAGGRK